MYWYVLFPGNHLPLPAQLLNIIKVTASNWIGRITKSLKYLFVWSSLKAAVINIFVLTVTQMMLCNVTGVGCFDESTEWAPDSVPLSSMTFSSLFGFYCPQFYCFESASKILLFFINSDAPTVRYLPIIKCLKRAQSLRLIMWIVCNVDSNMIFLKFKKITFKRH